MKVKYYERIDPLSGVNRETRIKFYDAVTKYILENTNRIDSSFVPTSEEKDAYWDDIYCGLTPDSIIIRSVASIASGHGTSGKRPVDWFIEVKSFATPVTDLVEKIREAGR